MDFETIQFWQENDVAHVVLNRPHVRNALSNLMISELHSVASLIDQRQPTITILGGNGPCFCSGVDIMEKKGYKNLSESERATNAERFVDVFHRVASLQSVLIGLAKGHVVGGGVGLLAACDVVISEPSAQFSVTATKVGILPAAMSTVLVQALGTRWAKYLSLTGQTIGCETARIAGLVHVVSSSLDAVDEDVSRVIQLLRDGERTAILATKQLFSMLQQDFHSVSRANRLNLVKGFTSKESAEERFERYSREGVFWHRT